MRDISALVEVLKRYGVDEVVIKRIISSKAKTKELYPKDLKFREASWALNNCKNAYKQHDAIDVVMLTKALPLINTTKLLRMYHDQIEDINLEYSKLEPIYVHFVLIAKTFRASFEFFEKIKPTCAGYDKLLKKMLSLATNLTAIEAVSDIGLQYYFSETNVEQIISNFEKSVDYCKMGCFHWCFDVCSAWLDHSHNVNDVKKSLPYLKLLSSQYYYPGDLYEKTILKMLVFSKSVKQIDDVLKEYAISGNRYSQAEIISLLTTALEQF